MTLIFDVTVIGAGPAGLMAAGTAAKEGAKVILLEKNEKPGRKLLITGSGRCNITNFCTDLKHFTNQYGDSSKYLHSIMNTFGPEETMDFFINRGLELTIEKENNNKVFPSSNKASDVLKVLIEFLLENKVKIQKNFEVKKIIHKNKIITGVESSKETIYSKNFILSTGGLSYPRTGSTGDGYVFARNLGHKIISPAPILVPVILKEKWTKNLEGLSMTNVRIQATQKAKTISSVTGDIVFTSNGMSGPAIYDLSKIIGQNLSDEIKLHIDFFSALDHKELDEIILEEFLKNSNKKIKNILIGILPPKLLPVVLKLIGMDFDKQGNRVTREERKELIKQIKDFQVTVSSFAGFEKAVITSGGIDLNEIDMKTMKSKIISNLFFSGEVIDVDGPTGGYNLQLCWSTGHVAGFNAAKF